MFTAYGSGWLRVEVWEHDLDVGRVRFLDLVSIPDRTVCSRQLSDISDCEIELPIPDHLPTRDRLAAMRTIRFEVDVWRDGDLLWSGVVTRLRFTRTRMWISAKDYFWWLTKRFVRTRIAFEDETGADGTEDVAVIAEAAIGSALLTDDPDLLRWVDYRTGGAIGMARVETWDMTTAMEVIDDLASTGLRYTALGRMLILSSVDEPFPQIGVFTDGDFTDDIEAIESADEACTLAAVVGGGVVGEAGGSDPYFGLVERKFQADSSITRTAPLQAAAAQQVAARNPPPLLINMPSGCTLSPRCEIAPSLLIPGAYAEIRLTHLLRPVSQTMRLQSVSFGRSGVNPEEVQLGFEPVGVIAETD